MTVEVFEYFQAEAFRDLIHPSEWNCLPRRVGPTMDRLLALLDRHGARATFFVDPWVAERDRSLVRRISLAGHDVGLLGTVNGGDEQEPDAFERSAREARAMLEEVSGTGVIGYRDRSRCIAHCSDWAMEALIRAGFRYDSSLCPTRCKGKGMGDKGRNGNGSPRPNGAPHSIERKGRTILEVPLAAGTLFGVPVATARGASLRHLPYAVIPAILRQYERRCEPATVSLRSWELDPYQPRLPITLPARLEHYTGLGRTRPALERLLNGFEFTSIQAELELDRKPTPT